MTQDYNTFTLKRKVAAIAARITASSTWSGWFGI
jgi:hypothetical protein